MLLLSPTHTDTHTQSARGQMQECTRAQIKLDKHITPSGNEPTRSHTLTGVVAWIDPRSHVLLFKRPLCQYYSTHVGMPGYLLFQLRLRPSAGRLHFVGQTAAAARGKLMKQYIPASGYSTEGEKEKKYHSLFDLEGVHKHRVCRERMFVHLVYLSGRRCCSLDPRKSWNAANSPIGFRHWVTPVSLLWRVQSHKMSGPMLWTYKKKYSRILWMDACMKIKDWRPWN